MRRALLSLALATGQPFGEVLTWDDRDIATARDLIEQARDGG